MDNDFTKIGPGEHLTTLVQDHVRQSILATTQFISSAFNVPGINVLYIIASYSISAMLSIAPKHGAAAVRQLVDGCEGHGDTALQEALFDKMIMEANEAANEGEGQQNEH